MQTKVYGSSEYFNINFRFEGEFFKEVPGIKPFEISNYGRVLSPLMGRNKILRPGKSKAGYHTVRLWQKSYSVHYLMRISFLPEFSHLREVDHVDGDKTNNTLDNIECVSSKDNKKRAVAIGLMNNTGENHGMAVLSESQVWQILLEYYSDTNSSRAKVAKKLSINEFTVKAIIDGKNWNHIHNKFSEQYPALVAIDRSQTKLNEEKVLRILDAYFNKGVQKKEIAIEFNMSLDAIAKILKGQYWKEVFAKFKSF